MEDRQSHGLYLEMADAAPEAYAEVRVAGLLARPGVLHASWWRNCRPGRSDLPRRLPEFSALGVYEVEAAFTPPRTPAGIRAHHFVRTARPGQGTLSGSPTLGLELVLVSTKTLEGAAAFRDWADFVHIRAIAAAAVPGFTMITPYRNASGGEPRFLHFYEMDSPDAEETFQRMTPETARRLGGFGSEAFREWAGHPELVIDYVNTFCRVGERARG
jgi:hypothetical protein